MWIKPGAGNIHFPLAVVPHFYYLFFYFPTAFASAVKMTTYGN